MTYDVIYADPPWSFSSRFRQYKVTQTRDAPIQTPITAFYPTMTSAALRDYFATEVAALAADPAVLLMWSTDAHLPLAIELGQLAGFDYRTVGFTWVKLTNLGNPKGHIGTWTVKNAEMCLLFAKGNAHSRLLESRRVRQLVQAPRRDHSRKPAEVRAGIEEMFPTARKVELFARERVPGWDALGNEVPA